MKRGPFIAGFMMMIIGIYCFWMYLQILWSGNFLDNIVLWVVTLTAGTLLISFGPGVMAWAYASSYQASYRQIAKQAKWQIIQIPIKCSECGNDLSIRTLEWIGDDEARCPFCSKNLEIRTSRSYL